MEVPMDTFVTRHDVIALIAYVSKKAAAGMVREWIWDTVKDTVGDLI